MTSSEEIVTSLSITNLLLFSFVILIFNIFRKIWWIPTRLQNFMASQGIKGPSYTLIHGNTKQVANMYREAMSKPLLDFSHDIVPVVLPHVHAWINIYGKNFLLWQGTQAQLVVTEPELCKEIFNNKDGAYPKPTSEIPKLLLGNGLPLLEGEKWAKSRKLANHTFHGDSLKNMIPQMIVSAETMVERWKNHVGQEIEVFQEFRLLTAEVISRTAFGSSYLQGQQIFDMLMKLTSLISTFDLKLKLPIISKFFKTSDEIEAEKLQKGIRNSVMEIVKEREEKATSGGEESFGSDFLGSLLKAYHDTNDKQRFSIDDIVDECKSFYFAGQETVNTLLAWTVFLLAHHTEWQEEARKEVLEIFGKETPNPNDLSKLKTVILKLILKCWFLKF